MTTIGGGGGTTWPLARESLRIPAGGSRLFALVDADQRARPGARSARVSTVGAVAVSYAPPIVVTQGNVFMEQGRALVAGNVVNTAEREGKAVVLAAFFDEDGAPLQRKSTFFALDGGGRRGMQMIGPAGSHSAYLFIGEVTY